MFAGLKAQRLHPETNLLELLPRAAEALSKGRRI